ncbi:MAG: hypothetical protein ACRC62_34790 [Microcoleus sp.]
MDFCQGDKYQISTINYQSTKRAGTGAPPLPLNYQLSTINSSFFLLPSPIKFSAKVGGWKVRT